MTYRTEILRALNNVSDDYGMDLGHEPSVIKRYVEIFRGPGSFLYWFVSAFYIAIAGATIYAILGLLDAETAISAVKWATGTMIGIMVVAAMELWFWSETSKRELMTEIQKVQLMVANGKK